MLAGMFLILEIADYTVETFENDNFIIFLNTSSGATDSNRISLRMTPWIFDLNNIIAFSHIMNHIVYCYAILFIDVILPMLEALVRGNIIGNA